MKSLVYLMTLITTAMGLVAPASANAQIMMPKPGIAGIPFGGFYSTIIYTPSPNNVTTTVTTHLGTGDNFDVNADRLSSPLLLPNGQHRLMNIIPYQRPIVIYRQQRNYPPAILTKCTTEILGSSKHSLVPIDRYTGKPCS